MRSQSVQTTWLPLVRSVRQVEDVAEQLAGGTSVPSRAWGLAVLVGVVLAIRFRSRVAPGLVGPLALMAAVPPAILVALGGVMPLFAARYLVFDLPPLAVLAALGWAAARPFVVFLYGVAMSGVAVAVTVGWIRGATLPDDPQAAAAFMAIHDAPGDVIVYSPVWARTETHYFLERRDDVAARDVGLRPGTVESDVPSLYLPEIGAGQVRSALLDARRVWVVGFPGSTWRPAPNVSADVYATLPGSGRILLERWFGDLRVQLVERAP
jgi:hypothetical protein